MNFQQLDQQLTGRCALRRKIANNTWAERRSDDRIAIRLHRTDILVFDRDGTIQFDTGGWMTVTTKERMNRYTPTRIYSNRGQWRAIAPGDNWETSYVVYADGMTWHPDRGFDGDLPITDAERVRAERARTYKAISRFVGSITPEQILDAFANSGGDCFICRAGGTSCLASHVEEGYFHATLALRAIEARKYFDPNVILWYIRHTAEQGQVDRLLTDNLRKYLRNNMAPEGLVTR